MERRAFSSHNAILITVSLLGPDGGIIQRRINLCFSPTEAETAQISHLFEWGADSKILQSGRKHNAHHRQPVADVFDDR